MARVWWLQRNACASGRPPMGVGQGGVGLTETRGGQDEGDEVDGATRGGGEGRREGGRDGGAESKVVEGADEGSCSAAYAVAATALLLLLAAAKACDETKKKCRVG